MLRYLRAVQEADGSLAAELLAGRQPLLARAAARRVRAADPAGGPGLAAGRAAAPATGSVLADGPRRRRVCGAQRPHHQPGSLGGERRLHPVHPRRRDRAGCSPRADLRNSATRPTAAAMARFLRDTADAWEAAIEDWIYVTDTALAREAGVTGYYVRDRPAGRGRSACGDAWHGRGAQPRHDAARRCRPTPWSAPTRWRWCASACARPTIRASWIACG